MATSLVKADLYGWQVEPDARAPVRNTQSAGEYFVSTGSGSTTTTVATAILDGAAGSYIGRLLMCLGGTANNIGEVVEVTEFNAATDTLTHTAFPSATASGDQFTLLDPPDPIVVESSSGSTSQVISAIAGASLRDEDNDTYNGHYLVPLATSNNVAGTKALITDFVSASRRFDATVGSTATGDYWLIRAFPKFWGPPEIAFGIEDITRETQTGELGADQDVKGSRTWSANCVLPLKGSGTAAGDGVVGVAPPELDVPLKAIFTPQSATGDAVVAQSGSSPANSTTVFNIATGGLSQFPVGSFVMNSGRVAVVTASAANGGDPDSITVNPPFFHTPIATEIVYGSYNYEPQLSGHKTLTLDCWKDLIEWRGYGGLPTVEIVDMQRNAVPKIRLGYSGNFWVTLSRTKPTPLFGTFDSIVPNSAVDCHAILVASGTTTATRLVVESCSIQYNHQVVQEDAYSLPDAVYGGRIVDTMPTASLVLKFDTSSPNASYDEVRRYYSSRRFSLLIQHGSRIGRTVAWYAHNCEWKSPEWQQSDGLQKLNMTVHVLRSELTDMPICTLGFC